MANLVKSETGLLFNDNFTEKTLMWSISPSRNAKALSFGDNGLQIKHTDEYTIYTITEPATDNYSCIVELDHVPYNYDDIGGIIVLSSNKEYAECQSYMALTPSSIGNSEHYYADLKALIRESLDGNYVTYTLNDDEDPSETEGKPSEGITNSDNTSSETGSSTTFVDVSYKYIKFIKLKYKYLFYASVDGYEWIDVGNVSFDDSGSIGFFLYASEDEDVINNSHFYVQRMTLYKDKYIIIQGIERTQEIELVDGTGTTLLRTDRIDNLYLFSRVMKTCTINTTTFPIPIPDAKVRLYKTGEYGNWISEYSLGDIYGGDEFTLEHDIKLYINGVELNPNEMYDLGTFYHGEYFIELIVKNNENYMISDLKLQVIQYSEYYGGEEAVYIALYDDSRTKKDQDYHKEITIDTLDLSESKTVFIKLLDKPVQDFYMTANDFRFKIVME